MATHDIIAIGASAGGVQTLRRLMSMLPQDIPASILVVGHAFSPDSLMAAQSVEGEQSLESAARAFEDKGASARRLRDRFQERLPDIADRYESQARGLEEQAAIIGRLLRDGRAESKD